MADEPVDEVHALTTRPNPAATGMDIVVAVCLECARRPDRNEREIAVLMKCSSNTGPVNVEKARTARLFAGWAAEKVAGCCTGRLNVAREGQNAWFILEASAIGAGINAPSTTDAVPLSLRRRGRLSTQSGCSSRAMASGAIAPFPTFGCTHRPALPLWREMVSRRSHLLAGATTT